MKLIVNNLSRASQTGIDHLLEKSLASYRQELQEGLPGKRVQEGHDRYSSMDDRREAWSVSTETGVRLYALIRDHEPQTLVETGVCNGVSTLYQLAALEKNGHGTLYSIDYPFQADQSLQEFREQTYDDFGGAQIPADKPPGWIIPDDLREHWTLTEGKSQRELPKLLAELDGIDWFLHDSEHSVPCMMMELELAWEWLRPDGLIVVDDISWTTAFDEFAEVRGAESGFVDTDDVGYLRHSDSDE